MPTALGMFAAEILVPWEEVPDDQLVGVALTETPAAGVLNPPAAAQSATVAARIAADLTAAGQTVRGWVS